MALGWTTFFCYARQNESYCRGPLSFLSNFLARIRRNLLLRFFFFSFKIRRRKFTQECAWRAARIIRHMANEWLKEKKKKKKKQVGARSNWIWLEKKNCNDDIGGARSVIVILSLIVVQIIVTDNYIFRSYGWNDLRAFVLFCVL